MFLTDAELKELTGYERNADRRRWLTLHGWSFEVAATGRPAVLRAYADKKLGMIDHPLIKTWQPNLAAFDR